MRLRRIRARAVRLRSEERGVSLIEVMMVASILTVVLGAILALSDTTAKLAPNDDERALVMDEARAGVYRMTRELRQATSAPAVSTGGDSVTFNVGATAVTYACTTVQPGFPARRRCTRTASGQTTAVVDHVNNPAATRIFTPNAGGNYVGVQLRIAAAGSRNNGHDHTIALNDGAYLRNRP